MDVVAGTRQDIVVGADARLAVALHQQFAFAAEQYLAFAEEGAFHVLVALRGVAAAVGQGVGGAVGHHVVAALAALAVDGGAGGVGKREVVHHHAVFLLAVQFEGAVAAVAAQLIGAFHGAVHRHMGAVHTHFHTVYGTAHSGRGAVVDDGDGVAECVVLDVVLVVGGNSLALGEGLFVQLDVEAGQVAYAGAAIAVVGAAGHHIVLSGHGSPLFEEVVVVGGARCGCYRRRHQYHLQTLLHSDIVFIVYTIEIRCKDTAAGPVGQKHSANRLFSSTKRSVYFICLSTSWAYSLPMAAARFTHCRPTARSRFTP